MTCPRGADPFCCNPSPRPTLRSRTADAVLYPRRGHEAARAGSSGGRSEHRTSSSHGGKLRPLSSAFPVVYLGQKHGEGSAGAGWKSKGPVEFSAPEAARIRRMARMPDGFPQRRFE